MEDVLWGVLVFGACGLLAWIGFRIEPHWVSKDGRRFMCNAQQLTARGEPQGRWRETRVILNNAQQVQVDQKRFMRRTSTFWKVASQSPSPPRNREIFVLTGFDDTGAPAMLALRLPKKSRAIPAMQALVGRGSTTSATSTSSAPGTRPSPPARETGRSADRSDPG